MIARRVLEQLLSYVLDGRGADEPVYVLCDRELRELESVDIRFAVAVADDTTRPRATYVLIVADGPAKR